MDINKLKLKEHYYAECMKLKALNIMHKHILSRFKLLVCLTKFILGLIIVWIWLANPSNIDISDSKHVSSYVFYSISFSFIAYLVWHILFILIDRFKDQILGDRPISSELLEKSFNDINELYEREHKQNILFNISSDEFWKEIRSHNRPISFNVVESLQSRTKKKIAFYEQDLNINKQKNIMNSLLSMTRIE